MRTTVTLAANTNTTPFEIFAQDIDDVIMLINYYIIVGATESNKENKTASKAQNKKEERIRVNDKTATGGWF